MFNDFEKAKTETRSEPRTGGPETGQLPPGVNEVEMDNLEK